MTELENIGKLAATASELLDAIRGGEIANMKAEHAQTLEDFVTAYNAKINEFTQQKGEALNQFNQEKAQAFAAADSQLQSRRAAVDAVLADVSANTDMFVHFYGDDWHSKSSLGITADPADNTISEWVKVPGYGYAYGAEKTKASVIMKRCYSASGGYPDFVTDKSRTFMQFVLASIDATSAEINERLAQLDLQCRRAGSWSNTSLTAGAQVVRPVGRSTFMNLFVRFVNVSAVDGEAPQEIVEFGGNARFIAHKVINFHNVPA